MQKPDLKIVDADFVGAHENLSAVASGFRENAQVVEDIRCALGHDGLADKFADFAGSWRLNRERMQTAFETLAQEIKRQLDDWKRLDEGPHSQTDTDGQTDDPSPDKPGGPSPDGPPPGGPIDTAPFRPPPPRVEDGRLGTSSPAPTTAHSVPQDAATTATGDALPVGDAVSSGQDSSAPAPGGDDIEVTIDETGETFRALIPPAAAGGGIAALVALFGMWQSKHSDTATPGRHAPSQGDLSPEQRLFAEFNRLRGEGESVDLTLMEGPRQPGDVLAILRGDDGSTAIVDLTPVDATGGAGGRESAALDAPEPAETPAEAEPANPDSSPAATGGGGTGAGAAEPLAPGASLGGTADPDSGAKAPLEAPAGFGAERNGAAATPSGSPAERLSPAATDLPPQENSSRSVAGATAGIGMAGMAASSSAQSAQHSAAGSRLKADELKRPQEHDSRKNREDAQ